MNRLIQWAALACLAWSLCLPSRAGAGDDVAFQRDVAPILERHCLRCHDAGQRLGELSLETPVDLVDGGYLVAGDPDASRLVEVVSRGDAARPLMPKEGSPLSDDQVQVLRRWIRSGGAWPDGVRLRAAPVGDRSWWSLMPVARVDLPDPVSQRWSHQPIDRFILKTLSEHGLAPSPPAGRATLIRRVTYDLTGLPPTPEEVAAFVDDPAPDAYERLVDRLLASPRYGEHWGRHWLDVVRFGESTGFERNVIIDNAWPFRDYVIESLNADKPFDQLAIEHLAGDVVGAGRPEIEVGTAFLVCGPYDNVGNQDAMQAAQIRANTIDEMIRAVSEAFLGLTVGCARCHDHKFDPITQRDYYRMYASLAGVSHGGRVMATPEEQQAVAARRQPLEAQRGELQARLAALENQVFDRAAAKADELEAGIRRPAVDRTGTEETFDPVDARFVRLRVESTDTNPDSNRGYGLDEFEVWTAGNPSRNVALAAAGGRAAGASRVAEDFRAAYSAALTIDGRFGARYIAQGPDLVIELARSERIERVVFSSDRGGAAGSHSVATFVGDYHIDVSPDGRQWSEVAGSHDRQPPTDAHRRRRWIEWTITAAERRVRGELQDDLSEAARELSLLPSYSEWWVGRFAQPPAPIHVFLGGSPQRHGPPVVAANIEVLGDHGPAYVLAEAAPEAERRLALARWIVAADNPLTPRVLANRLWHYHFGVGLVDSPSDFGAMGSRPTHPELLDWLAGEVHRQGWRLKPLHRMLVLSETYRQSSRFRPAAADRDAAARLLWRFPPRRLSAEEIRDTMLSLAGVLDSRLYGPGFRLYQYLEDNVATYVPLDRHTEATYRRAVYHQNARASQTDLMSEFDCPDCAFPTPRRSATTSPLQALTLMNHSFTLDVARHWAERLFDEAGPDSERQVRRAVELAYGRPPDAEELAECARVVRDFGLTALCRALLNSSELIYLSEPTTGGESLSGQKTRPEADPKSVSPACGTGSG